LPPREGSTNVECCPPSRPHLESERDRSGNPRDSARPEKAPDSFIWGRNRNGPGCPDIGAVVYAAGGAVKAYGAVKTEAIARELEQDFKSGSGNAFASKRF